VSVGPVAGFGREGSLRPADAETRSWLDALSAVRRLLGSEDPEIGCEACFRDLDRYVELEVSRADAEIAVPGMRAHLDGCPACAAEHESLLGLVKL
jgi:hypothetical protein